MPQEEGHLIAWEPRRLWTAQGHKPRTILKTITRCQLSLRKLVLKTNTARSSSTLLSAELRDNSLLTQPDTRYILIYSSQTKSKGLHLLPWFMGHLTIYKGLPFGNLFWCFLHPRGTLRFSSSQIHNIIKFPCYSCWSHELQIFLKIAILF